MLKNKEQLKRMRDFKYAVGYGFNSLGFEACDYDKWKNNEFNSKYKKLVGSENIIKIIERRRVEKPANKIYFDTDESACVDVNNVDIVLDYSSRAYACNIVKNNDHFAVDTETKKKIIKIPRTLVNATMKEGIAVVPFANNEKLFYAYTIGVVLFCNDEGEIESAVYVGEYTYNYLERRGNVQIA